MTEKAKTALSPEADMEQFKTELSAAPDARAAIKLKINSFQKFELVRNRILGHFATSLPSPDYGELGVHTPRTTTSGIKLNDHPRENVWWLWREFYREHLGVYVEAPVALSRLRSYLFGCGAMFPHVSLEDRTMVAYTPDRQSGEADRQVKTTFGRFVRKHMPLWTDAFIADLEAEYRSELDGTFLVAETVADVHMVYTSMRGDSGCMRYPASNFSQRVHPSAIYAAPQFGVRVAYLKNSSGEITARSVIYDNPDDPSDKRFVRLYGDPTLLSRLKRAGYRMAGLAGAKIPAIPAQRTGGADTFPVEGHQATYYTMAYMDPPGGRDSGCTTKRAYYVYKLKGEDFLRVTDTSDDFEKIMGGTSHGYADILTTAGKVALVELYEGMDSYVCAYSGTTHRRSEGEPVKFYRADGVELFPVSKQEAPSEAVILWRYIDGNATKVYVHPDHAAKVRLDCPTRNDVWNDQDTRDYYDIIELDAEFYGAGKYEADSNAYRATLWDGGAISPDQVSDRWVRKDDIVRVFGADNRHLFYVHVSQCKTLAAQGFVAVSPVEGFKAMTHKDNPNIVVTAGRRRMLYGHHEIRRLSDGTFNAARGVSTSRLWGLTVYTKTGTTPVEVHPEVAYLALSGFSHSTLVTNREDFERKRMRCGLGLTGYGGYYTPAGSEAPVRYTSAEYTSGVVPERAELVGAMNWILERSSDELAAHFGIEASNAKAWAETSKVFLAQMEVRCAELTERHGAQTAALGERVDALLAS